MATFERFSPHLTTMLEDLQEWLDGVIAISPKAFKSAILPGIQMFGWTLGPETEQFGAHGSMQPLTLGSGKTLVVGTMAIHPGHVGCSYVNKTFKSASAASLIDCVTAVASSVLDQALLIEDLQSAMAQGEMRLVDFINSRHRGQWMNFASWLAMVTEVNLVTFVKTFGLDVGTVQLERFMFE